MLATQVSYWTLQESVRHNKATEQETQRANKEAETINWFNANENKRHNVVFERETERHNLATEQETQRHNLATEDYYNNALAETTRHNVVTEQLGFTNAGISQFNAETNRYAAQQTAAIGWFNAEVNKILGERQSEINYMNALSQSSQAESAAKRAVTDAYVSRQNSVSNFLNAASSVSRATSQSRTVGVSEQQLDLSAESLDLEKKKQTWKEFNDTMNMMSQVGAQSKSMPTQPSGFTSLTP